MSQERESMAKVMNKGDVLALAFGAMIGWGWVVLAGEWVKQAGWLGATIAWVIGGVLCIFVGLCYAEMVPMLPMAGGALAYTYRSFGYKGAWFAIWACAFAYVGVAAWEGIAISTAIDYVVKIPKIGHIWNIAGYDVYASWAAIGILCGLYLTWVNYKGGKSAAVFQKVATLGLALAGVVFVAGGFVCGNPAQYMGVAITGTKGIVAVLLMAPAMYVGFDVIPQSAEEMNIPLKSISKILLLSIFLAAAWYILMCIGIAMAAPAEVRNAEGVAIADAAAYMFGTPWMGKFMIAGALCGIVTSWNGFILGGARILFAMGRAKMLPPIFGKLHPKYNSPYFAILIIGVICFFSPLLGKKALVWFVDASGLGVMITYLMVCASFLILRKREPNLHRPYKVPYGTLVGWLAVLSSIGFIMLFLPGSPAGLVWPYEWALVLVWAVFGVILAVANTKSYSNVTAAERELLIYGPEYARKEILNEEKLAQ